MNKLINKYGWWKITAGLYYLSGALVLVDGALNEISLGLVILAGIDFLIGRAFWQESIIVFRIVRILLLLSVVALVFEIMQGNGGFNLFLGGLVETVQMYVDLFALISVAMLWKKLRAEKKVKW
jgi:hypothetical protein